MDKNVALFGMTAKQWRDENINAMLIGEYDANSNIGKQLGKLSTKIGN